MTTIQFTGRTVGVYQGCPWINVEAQELNLALGDMGWGAPKTRQRIVDKIASVLLPEIIRLHHEHPSAGVESLQDEFIGNTMNLGHLAPIVFKSAIQEVPELRAKLIELDRQTYI